MDLFYILKIKYIMIPKGGLICVYISIIEEWLKILQIQLTLQENIKNWKHEPNQIHWVNIGAQEG